MHYFARSIFSIIRDRPLIQLTTLWGSGKKFRSFIPFFLLLVELKMSSAAEDFQNRGSTEIWKSLVDSNDLDEEDVKKFYVSWAETVH